MEDKPWHLSQAEIRVSRLRDHLISQVSRALKQRGWTQARAAEHLGVSQPRISDLNRGKAHRFTIDTLVEWLFALGKPVDMLVAGEPASGKNYPTLSEAEIRDQVDYYTDILSREPDNADAYGKRADAHHRLGEYDHSLADYARCEALEPQRCGRNANKIVVLRAAGRAGEAVAASTAMMERFPELNLYSNRGLAYMDLGKLEEALADLDRAIELEPQRPGPYWNRAGLLEQMGRPEDALRDYFAGLLHDPDNRQMLEHTFRLQAELRK